MLFFYFIFLIQVLIPIDQYLNFYLANIIFLIFYVLIFWILGNSWSVIIWLIFIFMVLTPYPKQPIWVHTRKILNITDEKPTTFKERMKYYILPF